MRTLGVVLQFLGLVIVPMALMYYWRNRGLESEAQLMFGELTILAVGATLFLLGRSIARR